MKKAILMGAPDLDRAREMARDKGNYYELTFADFYLNTEALNSALRTNVHTILITEIPYTSVDVIEALASRAYFNIPGKALPNTVPAPRFIFVLEDPLPKSMASYANIEVWRLWKYPQAPTATHAIAQAHWEYVRGVLESHGEAKEVIDKCGHHYVTAFEHGWKHARE